jgi:uncharacterized LabA/DUF88 family protein
MVRRTRGLPRCNQIKLPQDIRERNIDFSEPIAYMAVSARSLTLPWGRSSLGSPRPKKRGFSRGATMKTSLLIDGGYLRAESQKANKTYNPSFIQIFSQKCIEANEYLFRILYYDARPYDGSVQLPVSGKWKRFKSNDTLMDDLAKLERFACRHGSLGFRGWKPRNIPISGGQPLTDADFKPVFEQKGVDMRIGLDIAVFSDLRSVDRIILVSGDTDMIPAMKHARKSGLEIGLVQLPPPCRQLHGNILNHSDFVRPVSLP